jgi:carbonic anhydrase/acetyltransferase-like protein (isoleucine patch superfamily)
MMKTGWSGILCFLPSAIYGVPFVIVAGVAVLLLNSNEVNAVWLQVGWLLLAPLCYAIFFALCAGVFSLPFQRCIVAGKFPRDLKHPVYRGRRFYGLCWTALFYCKPVYYLCLTIPWLKWMTFRLFGYRGQMDFTIYPDTWIRDLPLLSFGKGAYIANRATLGTNMPLKNGKILVEGIKIGDGVLIGHLTMIAAGTEIGANTEIESGVAVGLRVKVGNGCFLGGTCSINHFANIMPNSRIAPGAYVGFRERIHGNADPLEGNTESDPALVIALDRSISGKEINHR